MLHFSKIRVIIISIFTILLALITFSNFLSDENNYFNKKIKLGLDLQGGSYLLLEIDNSPLIIQTVQNKFVELKKFFKDQGIEIKNIKIINDKIQIINKDLFTDKVYKTLTDKENTINPYYPKYKTNQFNVSKNENLIDLQISDYGLVLLKSASQEQAIEIVRRRIDELGTNEPNIMKRGSNRILVELPGLDDPGRIKVLLGKTANLTFQFISSSKEETFGSSKMYFEDGTEEIVSKRIVLSGENLIDAKPVMDNESNQAVVSFSLDRVGAKKFGKATTTGVGKRLAIVLDGKIISAPSIREPIIGGSGQITGGFDFQSATDLALLLRSGALPAPLEIVEERTVGPDLGQDSIDAGILSLIIGFSMVILFMLYKYKIFGFIANIALITNLFFLIGILTLFEATLTLPGIAGIILTVGMAVDANVLIYERIKEEIKQEKNKIIAFDRGYTKSRTTIIDANLTTLIAAIILFFMGSGPIKGFSVTLGVGIITSLISVYFISRTLTVLYLLKNKEKENII